MNMYRNITQKQLNDLKENYFYFVGNCKTVLEFVNYMLSDETFRLSKYETQKLKAKRDKLVNFYNNLLELNSDL